MPKGVYPRTEKHRRITSVAMTGIKRLPFSEAWKEKIRQANLGKKRREETKERLRLSHLGYTHTEEQKEKIGLALKGVKSHFWRGGIGYYPYPVDWKKTLRIAIRERDKYICRICGKHQEDRAHAIHHIDYNKNNCNPDNLITLCNSCHAKTCINRNSWIEYFEVLICQ